MKQTRRELLRNATVATVGLAAGAGASTAAEETAVDVDPSVFNDRGLWDWVPYTIIMDGETVMDGYDGRYQLFFDKADAHGIGTFYPHYSDPTSGENLEEPVRAAPDADVEAFLRECHANDINIEPLIGGGVAGWVASKAWPQAQSILDWNAEHPPEESFDGIHINVENGDRYEVKPEILDNLDQVSDDLHISMAQDPMWTRNTDNARVREVMEHRNLDYYCTMVYDLNFPIFWPNLGRVTQPFDTPFVLGQGINEHGHPNRNWSDADSMYSWVEENWVTDDPDTSYQYIDDETGEKYIGLAMHSFWGLIDAPEVGGETNIGEPSREYQTDPYADSIPEPDPEPDNPTAVVSGPDIVEPDTTVEFDASASTSPGTITDYQWDLDDGTTTSGESVTHSYSETGTYTVSLTVTDYNDNTDTVEQSVTVEEPDQEAPVASFEVMPETPTVGEEVTFDASASTAPAGDIVEYGWDYDLQPGLEPMGETFTHIYESADTYDVRLVVTDDNGNQGETIQTITVESADDGDGDDGDDGGSQPEYPAWDSGTTYTGGDRVTYEGSVWEASWWTRGDEPGSSQWGPWEQVEEDGGDNSGDDGGNDGGDNDDGSDGGDDGGDNGGDDGGDDGSDESLKWDPMSLYQVGDRVTYDGSTWEATLASLNAEPGPNSAYWTEVN
ncbi:PKD domain-containing protein [Halovenus marina]|uniref:PKD domain-containing protein n=1 Tax=Halovenus marina TaxID=3396621 RepID=UPI003F5779A7